MLVQKIKLPSHSDSRGGLVSVEGSKDIPFEVKRVYYIFDTAKGVTRGYHAHKKLKQILICVHGSCKIKLDDGSTAEETVLDDPAEGLYVSSALWREMSEFSEGAVLLVLASELYDEADYIRDYEEFKKYVSEEKK